MIATIEGRTIDTAELLDMGIGPVERWLGGEIDLLGVYADRNGRLYVLQRSRHIDERTGEPVGWVLTPGNREMVRYLTERFELPAAYLKAAPPAEERDDD